jgi:hypothetical protein
VLRPLGLSWMCFEQLYFQQWQDGAQNRSPIVRSKSMWGKHVLAVVSLISNFELRRQDFNLVCLYVNVNVIFF